MKQELMDVVIGGMLHDIGKLLYRYNDNRNYSTSGYEFMKERCELNNDSILEQVKYHHASLLKNAEISSKSLAYITYIADNIASMADRREKDESGMGFVKELPMESIFNTLNGNHEKLYYQPSTLEGDDIVFPTDKAITYSETYYRDVLDNICKSIKGISYSASYINSLLEVLEANTSYVPSSTSMKEIADISLFDHVKMTAALGCCIYLYLEEKGIQNYKERLFEKSKTFYSENAFMLYSMDISGIQDFIYTINSSKALKNLRARSFYLEIMMEHIVDEFLEKLSLTRTNLIYCGGGHAYLLVANTQETKAIIKQHEKDINQWFMKHFGTALYIAGGYSPCSANDLQNSPQGSYSDIFRKISNMVSEQKMSRYTSEDIIALNHSSEGDEKRECKVCHTSSNLVEDQCVICRELENFSNLIQQREFFVVVKEKPKESFLVLPNHQFLVAMDEKELFSCMKEESYNRTYCKNKLYTGQGITSKIWVGDYEKGNTFEELANNAQGIPRLGVLRADIDNLGQAFVSGFDDKNVSLSRTATFSRKLSIFFKRNMNHILKNGDYYLSETGSGERNASIIYSGGDDVFIVGAWDDIIGLAMDINCMLRKYTQGTLTISAGIGIYNSKYPIKVMAKEVGELEELSKQYPDKNAITLFEEGNTYCWDEFINGVVEDKFRVIYDFFEPYRGKKEGGKATQTLGKAFLYKLVDYMRNQEDKINLARFAYLLARMEPKNDKFLTDKENQNRVEIYQSFAKDMYKWIKDPTQCRQAITAMYLYVYMTRE